MDHVRFFIEVTTSVSLLVVSTTGEREREENDNDLMFFSNIFITKGVSTQLLWLFI